MVNLLVVCNLLDSQNNPLQRLETNDEEDRRHKQIKKRRKDAIEGPSQG